MEIKDLYNLNKDELTAFIHDRIDTLSNEQKASVFIRKNAVRFFIKNNYGIFDIEGQVPLCIKDNSKIIEFFVDFLKNNDEPKNLTELLTILEKANNSYFGGGSNKDMRRDAYNIFNYEDFEEAYLYLEDFKGKNVAMCLERSIFAHQCLKFLGFDSIVVTGDFNFNGYVEKHVFNVIEYEGKRYIFDILNPDSQNKIYFKKISDIASNKFEDNSEKRIYDIHELCALQMEQQAK